MKTSVRLSAFGLASVHVLTSLTWLFSGFHRKLATVTDPVCFPYFSNCDQLYGQFSVSFWAWIFFSYVLLSILSLPFILKLKSENKILIWLAALMVFKFCLLSLDYMNMGNYHYMHLILSLAVIALPYKHFSIYMFVTLFYFAAGLLKFNPEWLSGAALVASSPIKGPILALGLIWVVILESCLIWLLLLQNRKVSLFLLAQLVFFHGFSWVIVGSFYPLTMLGLLLPIFWDLYKNETFEWPNLNANRFSAIVVYGCGLLFLVAQVIPLVSKEDSALDGKKRLLSLNMLDAYTECLPIALLKTSDGAQRQVHVLKSGTGVRIQCDPILFESSLKNICKKTAAQNPTLRFVLYSKRRTDLRYTKVRDFDNYCANIF